MTHSAQPSATIWEAFRARPDETTFAPLHAATHILVWTLCWRVLADEELASDARQATWCRLVAEARAGRLPSLTQGEWPSYLGQLALREAWSLRKRCWRRARKELTMDDLPAMPDPAETADTIVAHSELRGKLEALVGLLPERQRLPIQLCYFHGLSQTEVARLLGRSDVAVSRCITRGLKRLEGMARRAGLREALGSLLLVAGGAALLEPPVAQAQSAHATWATVEGLLAGAGAGVGPTSFMGSSITKGGLKMILLKGFALTVLVASIAGGWLMNRQPSLPAARLPAPPTEKLVAAAVTPAPVAEQKMAEADHASTQAIEQTVPTAPASLNNEPHKPAMQISVLDDLTSQPLANVTANIGLTRRTGEYSSKDQQTDAAGLVKIETSLDIASLTVKLHDDGHVPMQIQWREIGPEHPLPAQYVQRMERGTTIGGLVKNEQDEPIAGAKVFVLAPQEYNNAPFCVLPLIWDEQVETNPQGQWHYDLFPRNGQSVWLRLTHPDYMSDNTYRSIVSSTNLPPLTQLRQGKGAMTMRKGIDVMGEVVDPAGKPVAGAIVMQGSDRIGTHYPDARTDAQGRFEFRNCEAGDMVLTTMAGGYAPNLLEIVVKPGLSPLRVSLQPGCVLRGRLVDPQGKPVAGAFAAVDTWRSHRSLEWRVDTDAQGCFEWRDAPGDKVLMDFGKEGMMSLRGQELTARDEPYTLVMYPVLKVHGLVRDAVTSQPLATFKITRGEKINVDKPINWFQNDARDQTGGVFTTKFNEPYNELYVKVEASDYLSTLSRPLKPDEQEVTLEFAMRKGSFLHGWVKTPAGEPAVGADVIVSRSDECLSVSNGNIVLPLPEHRKTNETGHFELEDKTAWNQLSIIHEAGLALLLDPARFRTQTVIQLQPWSRIEGTLARGADPWPNQPIQLQFDVDPEKEHIKFGYEVQTDDLGNFVFERVPPGLASIGRWIHTSSTGVPGESWSALDAPEFIECRAGQTTNVILGGRGRPVAGRLAQPTGTTQAIQWPLVKGWVRLATISGEPPLPPEIKQDHIKYLAWRAQWLRAPEGLAIERAGLKQYPVVPEDNGTFRVEDVLPGDWKLVIKVPGVGQIEKVFTIPVMDEACSPVPLDLGTLALDPELVIPVTPSATQP